MQFVAPISIHQKDSLVGQLVQPNWYFYPVLSGSTQWIISEQEMNASIYPEHEWVKDLPLVEYVPISESNLLSK